MHKQCYTLYMETAYKCPICSKSVVNMETQFRKPPTRSWMPMQTQGAGRQLASARHNRRHCGLPDTTSSQTNPRRLGCPASYRRSRSRCHNFLVDHACRICHRYLVCPGSLPCHSSRNFQICHACRRCHKCRKCAAMPKRCSSASAVPWTLTSTLVVKSEMSKFHSSISAVISAVTRDVRRPRLPTVPKLKGRTYLSTTSSGSPKLSHVSATS